jgi:hypothetical protein
LVLSGVINGSLSISVCARISDRLAAGRVITLAWRKGHRTFPVARPRPRELDGLTAILESHFSYAGRHIEGIDLGRHIRGSSAVS